MIFFRANHKRNFVAYIVAMLVLAFMVNTGMNLYAQNQTKNQNQQKTQSQPKKKNEIKEETSFKRPEPKKPIKPEVPSVNRYQADKVFLEYADSLYKVEIPWDTTERQILKGNVKFRQAGMWMYCDSAYYYPTQNSLDAFSSVKMEQGDTLFVYADKLFYNGNQHLAKLINGPTRNKVTLINKDVTLTTDSMDYDVQNDLGWYTRWGTIDDKVNTLTSLYGEYSPRTKKADFYHDVVLINNKDGYKLYTDTLHYSTATHVANIESRTEIQSANDTIITYLATYYTDSGNADLLSRSLIMHRDSTGNVTTLEGDSIVYDNQTRISRAYMFKSPNKRPTPMVINDTAQKTRLIGGFGMYNDVTREAMATYYPLLIEYSREDDTVFLRADVIRTYIVTEMKAVKKRRTKSGLPEHNGSPIVKEDNGLIWIDTTFFTVSIPYLTTAADMLFKVAPPYKKQELSDQEIIVETVGSYDNDDIEDEDLIIATDSPIDVSVTEETPQGIKDIIQEKQNKITDPDNNTSDVTITETDSLVKVDSVPYESHVALAYHRARFFKKDMQGVADSMVFVEKDSMLYLFRKPIVWSEERQVTGNRIDVHFNDSTSDWAYLPEFGLVSEHVEEDFYNQLYGKEITAYFEDQGLRRMSVEGSVETIFLPQEEDSTYNRLVNAESSFMEVYMDSAKLDWLKMWPEVNGTVTPLFMIKRNQMYLQKFRWWDFLRPERAWYGDQMKWADNLGEIPDALEQYFNSPSDFGEPKSFSGTRVSPPPGTLPIWEAFPEVDLNDVNEIDGITDQIEEESSLQPSPKEVPDSLISGQEEKLEGETLEDIENEDNELENEAKATEEQTQEIEEAIKKEDNKSIEDEVISTTDQEDDDDEEQTIVMAGEDDDDEPTIVVEGEDDDE